MRAMATSTWSCSRDFVTAYELFTLEVFAMRHALVLAVVLAASTAAAQPRPPCAVTIDLAIASPSPAPSVERLREESIR